MSVKQPRPATGSTDPVQRFAQSAPRIPPEQQEPGFLRQLQARGEVMNVAENWNEASEVLPPHVNWVLYPNGDLMHVRI